MSKDRFEYKLIEGRRGSWKVNVIVDGLLTGSIKIVEGGFAYFPKGSKQHGEVFGSVAKAQQSLEEE